MFPSAFLAILWFTGKHFHDSIHKTHAAPTEDPRIAWDVEDFPTISLLEKTFILINICFVVFWMFELVCDIFFSETSWSFLVILNESWTLREENFHDDSPECNFSVIFAQIYKFKELCKQVFRFLPTRSGDLLISLLQKFNFQTKQMQYYKYFFLYLKSSFSFSKNINLILGILRKNP